MMSQNKKLIQKEQFRIRCDQDQSTMGGVNRTCSQKKTKTYDHCWWMQHRVFQDVRFRPYFDQRHREKCEIAGIAI